MNRYASMCDKLTSERDAWKVHARRLAQELSAARKEDAGVDTDERLAAYLESSEARARAQGGASPSGTMPVEPSDAQARAIEALISRGTSAGWLIDPEEVSARQGSGTRVVPAKGVHAHNVFMTTSCPPNPLFVSTRKFHH